MDAGIGLGRVNGGENVMRSSAKRVEILVGILGFAPQPYPTALFANDSLLYIGSQAFSWHCTIA